MSTDKKILIIDDEDDIVEILQVIVESHFDNPIVTAKSGNEAIKYLREDPEIGFILSDYSMPDGNGGKVYEYNKENLNLPFFLITGGYTSDYPEIAGFLNSEPLNRFFQKPLDDEAFLKALEEVINLEIQKPTFSSRRVRISCFKKYYKGEYDVFIKLSDEKLVKIIEKNIEFAENTFSKYEKKGTQFIYLFEDDYKDFSSKLISQLMSAIEKAKSEEDIINATASTVEFISSDIVNQGQIGSEEIKLIDNCVKGCLKNLKNDKKISDLTSDMFKVGGYLVRHSITAIYLSQYLCRSLGFNTESVLEKLTYASLLHDICILDSDLSAVLFLDSDEFENLERPRKKQIREHILQAVNLVNNNSSIPDGVANIIHEHHERPDGSGFPRSLTHANVSALGSLFHIALVASDYLSKNKISDATAKLQFIELLNTIYLVGVYKKPTEEILKLLEA